MGLALSIGGGKASLLYGQQDHQWHGERYVGCRRRYPFSRYSVGCN